MDAKSLVAAWTALQGGKIVSAYMARGRQWAGLTDAALAERWVVSYRAWALQERPDAWQAEEDARAEMTIRSIELPLHLVEAESNIVMARIEANMPALLERAEAGENILNLDEIEEELRRRH